MDSTVKLLKERVRALKIQVKSLEESSSHLYNQAKEGETIRKNTLEEIKELEEAIKKLEE